MSQFRYAALLLLCLLLPARVPAAPSRLLILDAGSGQAVAGASIVFNGIVFSGMPAPAAAGEFAVPGHAGSLFVRAPGYRAARFDLAALPADGVLRLAPFLPRAVYLSVYGAGSKQLLGNVLALARSGGVNAVVVDVKGDAGLIAYPSAIPLATQDGARRITFIPNLAAFVNMLHENGLYAIARIVTFKDNPLAQARPVLAVHTRTGALYRDREGMAWTDPTRRPVWDYNLAVAEEAARAGFDEIQFDYLRFPDAPRALRFAQEADEPSRIAAISGFLAAARQRLLPYNVYVGADIFGYVCWNRNDTGIGQTLAAVAPEVDYLSPMLYASGFQFGIPGVRDPVAHAYDIVYLSLSQAQRRLGIPARRFRPWLQAFKDYAFDRRNFAAAEVAEQIRAATDFGSDGWMLWNPRNDYGNSGLGAGPAMASAKIVPPSLPGACS